MRQDGQITVFLSLVLVCVLSLLCGLLESARMAGSAYYLQMAADSALQSVFSSYNKELWDRYRILGVWGGPEDIKKEFSEYLTAYMESSTFYPSGIGESQVDRVVYLTDENGRYFEQEILDYMKYGIWTLDIKPEDAEPMFGNIKESFAAEELSDTWKSHMKSAEKLEQALENIMECHRQQEEYKRDGVRYLKDCDGSGFQRSARALIRQVERLPSLTEKYENAADKLKKELEKTEKDMAGKMEETGGAAAQAFLSELQAYQTYVDADGDRRNQVRNLARQAPVIIDAVNGVMAEADDVESYISSWEPEDEEDDLDEDALWAPVRERFSNISLGELDCKAGVQDEKSKGFLEKVEELVNLDILSLVLPEGKNVSQKSLMLQGNLYEECYQKALPDESSLIDRLFVGEYGLKVFPDFLNGKEDDSYEAEYIIGGEKTDRGNLKAVVTQLLAVREGANLLFLLSDGQKRGEAQALAAAIVGVTGIAPLVMALSFFILSVWALGEAIQDVRQLLDGGKIPFFKTQATWKLSLSGLLDMGKTSAIGKSQSDDSGFSYEGYLKLFLFFQEPARKRYRMMDLIQMNVRKKESGFLMKQNVYSVEMKAEICGKHVFLALPMWTDTVYEGSMSYLSEIKTEKSY